MMKEGWNSDLWSEIDGNCIFADGLGAIWKIFSQTSHMRPEAKVDLGGHMTTLSKWYEIKFRGNAWQHQVYISYCIGMLSEVAEFQTLSAWKNQTEVNWISQFLPHTIHKYAIWRHSNMLVKWPLRSTLASDLFWWVRLNIVILNSNPKPSTIFNSNQFFAFFSNSSFGVYQVPHHYHSPLFFLTLLWR